MRYYELTAINETEEKKVKQIANSIINNGWIGAPILYVGGKAITGSHRLAALALIDEMHGEEECDLTAEDIENRYQVYEDVEDLLQEYIDDESRNTEGYQDIFEMLQNMQCDFLSLYFKGTRIQVYSEEIAEW